MHFGHFAKPPKVSQRTYHTLATHNNYPSVLREPNTLWVVVISAQSVLREPDTLWVVTVKYPKCATTTQHTLGSYCKVPKVCWVLVFTLQYTCIIYYIGASSGIGAGAAIHFASLGAKLSLTGRNKENLESTRTKCIENGLSEDNVSIRTQYLDHLYPIVP